MINEISNQLKAPPKKYIFALFHKKKTLKMKKHTTLRYFQNIYLPLNFYSQ